MPGLTQIDEDKALLYFEIALPKMLHMKVRKKIKTEALLLLDLLVNKKLRNTWSGGKLKYKPKTKEDPSEIRTFVERECAKVKFPNNPTKELHVKTIGCDTDFYCWTGNNRICYHAFSVWIKDNNTETRQRIEITHSGMDLVVDLQLVMAYPTNVEKSKKVPTPIQARKKTRKKTAKKSKRKSTRKK